MMENVLIFIAFFKKLYQNRYMIGSMARRNLKARYVGSMFGFLWAVLEPLSHIAIYGVIFGVVFKSRPSPGLGDNFFIYLICGIIPFQFFTQTITQSAGAIVDNSNLIKKSVGFHSEILPVITTITNIFEHLIGVALMLIAVLIFGGKFSPFLGLIFFYLFFISIFSVGLGWILSSLNVYLRDIERVLGVVMRGLFFFTPVVYSPEMIPGNVLWILKLNPLYHLVFGYRHALLAAEMIPIQDIAYLAAISIFTFGLGGIFFRKLKGGFVEVL